MSARCPGCHSDEFYWSRKGNDGVPLLIQLFLVAGRCRACGRISLTRGPLLLGATLQSPPIAAKKQLDSSSGGSAGISDSSADLRKANLNPRASDSRDSRPQATGGH